VGSLSRKQCGEEQRSFTIGRAINDVARRASTIIFHRALKQGVHVVIVCAAPSCMMRIESNVWWKTTAFNIIVATNGACNYAVFWFVVTADFLSSTS